MLQTPSQTVGPYFAYGLCPEQYLYDFKSLVPSDRVTSSHPATQPGTQITITGKIFDGEGVPIPDAMVEIWQNDGKNRLFGRFGTGTDPENRFVFHTLKPEPVDGQAPFITLMLFMRGQLIHSYTRIYFSDEEDLNEKDEALGALPADRRHTLIAQKNDSVYTFDIHMQGENETVFFDV